MNIEREKAPDFANGYPSAGELIGPAWQCMWDAMQVSTEPVMKVTLHAMVLDQVGMIAVSTIENLLRTARKMGMIDVSYAKRNSRKHSLYTINRNQSRD